MVTGANTGIGRATCCELARLGAAVVMVCRSRQRGSAALEAIQKRTGNPTLELLQADFRSPSSVRHLADEFKKRHDRLHVLVNNAGVICKKRSVTEDGLETQFAVNYLAPFVLTHLLLDRLRSGAPSRIVNVSSNVHHGASIDFEDLQHRKSYRPNQVYAETKLANIIFTYELARRLKGDGVTVNCLHPGVVATNMLADWMGIPRASRSTLRATAASPEKGARTSAFLATSPQVEGVTGRYFVDCKPAASSLQSRDENVAARLWRVSRELAGLDAQ